MKTLFKLILTILLMSVMWSNGYADDTLGYQTAAATSLTIGAEGGVNEYGCKYTSSTGGSLNNAYIYAHGNWNGIDSLVLLIYDDTGGYPNSLIAESNILLVNTDAWEWRSAIISGTILASTTYWLFVRNKSLTTGSVVCKYDANTILGYRTQDDSPTDDPFANGAIINDDQELALYVTYTVSSTSSSSQIIMIE